MLSPTFRAVHAAVRSGEVGPLLSGRARYGWAGPDWNEWFYRPGGGSLFDLGVYNVTSLCALFGPARRVTAMVGVAIPERVVNGRAIQVEAEDNAQVLLDFGESRFASVTTGFTMQKYRSPAIELYGSAGTIQLLGDDWAPEGWELWRNEEASWRLQPETDPHWQWTEGLRHLIDCVESGRPTISRPEHAYHALEIMLAAQAAGRDGTTRTIESDFPDPVYDEAWLGHEAERSPTTAGATMGYKPSPRPSFDAPTVLRADGGRPAHWGDTDAGLVEDWIYVSSQLVHAIVFGMPPGGKFHPLRKLPHDLRRR